MAFIRIQYLGDIIGGAPYFGKCPDCGRQHMSTADRVMARGHECVCFRCAMKTPAGDGSGLNYQITGPTPEKRIDSARRECRHKRWNCDTCRWLDGFPEELAESAPRR